MDNIVEYVIRVRDLLSGQLGGAARNAGKSFTDIAAGMRGVDAAGARMSRSVAGGIERVGSSARKAAQEVDGLGRSMERASRGGVGFADILKGNLATAAIVMGAQAIGSLVGNIVKQGAEGEVLKAQFGVLAGAKGEGLYGNLTKWIGDSVFGTEQYANARTMLGFGIGADEVMPAMKRLGDISMGDKEKMSGLTLAYSQVRGANKMQGQDWHQFINAGWNPLEELSVMTGKSIGTLTEEMSKGKISFDMVSQALAHATGEGGKFHGMLDKMSNTLQGKWDQMTGNIGTNFQAAGLKMQPMLMGLMDSVMKLANGLPSLLDRAMPYFEKIGSAIDKLMPVMMGLGSSVMQGLKPLVDLALSDNFVSLLASVGKLANTLLDVLQPILSTIGKAVDNMLPILTWVANKLNEGAKGAKSLINDPVAAVASAGMWLSYAPNKSYDKNVRDPFERMRRERLGVSDSSAGSVFSPNFMGLKAFGMLPMNAAMAGVASPTALARNDGKGASPQASAAMAGVSEAIVGGGRKNITININHEMVRQNISVSGAAGAFEAGKDGFREALSRVLVGVAGSV